MSAAEDLPIGYALTPEAFGARWEVTVSVPELALTLISQAVDWMVAPTGVDPVAYAHERLTVVLGGADPTCPLDMGTLKQGTEVVCRVRHREELLAEVTRRVGDDPPPPPPEEGSCW